MDSVSKPIQIKVINSSIPGFLAQPNAEGVFPGMVVIQEWWGLADHIKEVCMRLARQGFVAVAPDLYHGKVGRTAEENMALRAQVSDKGVMEELDGSVTYLKEQAFVKKGRIGVIGFCFGGRYSLLFGCHSKELAATVVYYGPPINTQITEKTPLNPIDLIPNLASPLLGIFGEADASIPLGDVGKLREALQKAGKSFEIKTYPGAQHAFNNDTNAERHHPEASKGAWQRTIDFLNRHLKG